MGGNAKKWAIGAGIVGLAALTGGAAAALAPGGMGFLGGLATGAGVGALQAGNTINQMNQAEAAERTQKEANRQAEAAASREAGQAPKALSQNDNLSDIIKRKSAMRRAIVTASNSASQKLGD